MDAMVFRKMSYGVYILTTMDGERPTGCTVNSIMQITSEPATVAVSVNHDNYTNGCIEKGQKFAFNILSEQSDPSLIGVFGFQSGKNADKFDGIEWELKSGAPVLAGTNGYVVCKVIDKMETATHTVFLGEVIDGALLDAETPQMTYAYYHQVIRGKSPKNAPTYIPEEKQEEPSGEKKVTYVCQVCGYVYEGDPLPEDFICPVCKQGADKFVRVEN